MELTWRKVVKSYKGGQSVFQIAVPKGVRLSKSDWQEILEWLGENTSGGKNYGYSIDCYYLGKKSPTLKVIRYPAVLSSKLMGLGTKLAYVREMI